MSEIEIILQWQRCEQMADEIGMNLTISSGSILLSEKKQENSFKGFWSANDTSSLLGFMCGVLEAKRVLKEDKKCN